MPAWAAAAATACWKEGGPEGLGPMGEWEVGLNPGGPEGLRPVGASLPSAGQRRAVQQVVPGAGCVACVPGRGAWARPGSAHMCTVVYVSYCSRMVSPPCSFVLPGLEGMLSWSC